MLSATLTLRPWWNFVSERKVRQSVMMGGTRTRIANASLHKNYFKKFRKNAFPNRTRQHWNVSMTGIARQRPRRMPWPYDICSVIFNRPMEGSDKIGYVVGTAMAKTAVVATNHLVYYPKFNVRVSRSSRLFAHDEDMACVDGDLVHVKSCRKISRYKHYYVFSILEPNVEGRERLKIGLRSVPPPLFGHPVSRRIVKLNLTKPAAVKQKAASVVQEHVQEWYRYAGRVSDSKISRAADAGDASFDDVNVLVAPNAPPTLAGGDEAGLAQLGGAGGTKTTAELEAPTAFQTAKAAFWMAQTPKDQHDYNAFTKAP
jgi:small subunit ribosomal protein S17